ncbi:hypothetical protein CASFOL_038380 [Castilleja foliolosa]|uniref:F-box domain-containing protein n=1 Tax=Castilleja foliolosa TaxID=1961234 RepID=A0ABD3BLB3_9LAMI
MAKLFELFNEEDEAEKPSSAQIVASIGDLLIKIIQPLPLKPIFQLTLVSKYWNSLISDLNLFLSSNIRPAVGLIFEVLEKSDYPNSTYAYSYIISLDKSTISRPIQKMTSIRDTWYRHCKILHSCNGLVLCVSNPAENLSRRYYVCNPTIKKYIILPKVVVDHNRLSIHGMYLVFDPSKSPHNYKVVCLLRSFGDWLHFFDVYSSETGTWRKGSELFKADKNFDFGNGVYWNGAIHWVNIVTKPRKSVYFSLDCDQTLKVFPNPPLQDTDYDKSCYYFGESYDHLHFVDSHRKLSEIIVYEMKRDYSEWFVKYKVNVAEIKRNYLEWDYSEWFMKHKVKFPEIHRDYEYFCKYIAYAQIYTVVRVKNDEDSFLVIKVGRTIVRYNFKQKTCETLCNLESALGDRWVHWGSARSFQNIESICPV